MIVCYESKIMGALKICGISEIRNICTKFSSWVLIESSWKVFELDQDGPG